MHVPRASAALIVALVVVACGGGALSTPASNTGATASASASSISSPIASPTRAVPSAATSATRRAATPAAPASAAGSGVVIGDVCAMFTADELVALTGHPLVGMTTEGILSDEVGCIWSFESPTPGITWDLVLSFLPVGGRVLFEESKPYAATGSPIPDLGVDNYPSGGNIIYALKGDAMVTVQYVNLSDDANRDQVPVEIMRRALDTLP